MKKQTVKPVKGYLEILDRGFGFLRSIKNNFKPDREDTFVPIVMVKRFKLSEGVFIEGSGTKSDGKKGNVKLDAIDKINGLSPDAYSEISSLKNSISINPSERLILTQTPDDLMGKALDIIVPVGKGQRGLIISPPKSGKTTILKHMANSIVANHPDVKVFILLVDERPEEVTDFRRGVENAHVLASSADQSISDHLRMARLTMNVATRYAETGHDAVVLIDSLTRLSRAFNSKTQSHGRTLSGGLGANTMEMPRRFFGAARDIEDGGSLTIIATILVDTGSRMDDVIFQEFKGTGNMDLALSRKCAQERVWPAININQSGTRKEHLLLCPEELSEVIQIRRDLSRLDETRAMSALLEHLGNPDPFGI